MVLWLEGGELILLGFWLELLEEDGDWLIIELVFFEVVDEVDRLVWVF